MQNGPSSLAAACAVCGSREVRTDAVEQGGWLLLAECPRCDHRWTQRLCEAPAPVRAPARVAAAAVRPEVANAA
jgi:uncharacterized Zn finger protein